MSQMRKTAWQGLQAVMLQGQYASLWMRGHLDGLKEEEKRWVTAVIYGVLRQRFLVRKQWADLVRCLPEAEVALLIDMSVYQLFWLNQKADYAVVNEAVSLCPVSKKGLVNAVLRQVLRRGRIPDPEPDTIAGLSLLTSHPEWLLRLWKAHYGEEKMRETALADLSEGRLCVRINPLKLTQAEIAANDQVRLLDNGWTLKTQFNPVNSEWLKDGKIVIQDDSSQQVALFLDVQPGESILDACAAPGTKTVQLAAMMNNQGRILAADLHAHRLKLIDQLAERCGAAIIETRQMDAVQAGVELRGQQFDRILADVPCSGLGVLRHKPEILCRLTPADLDAIVELQQQILSSVSMLLKPKGTLVYSTCTLNRKENDKQIAAFLSGHPDFELIEEKTLFPTPTGGDGFYMAKVLRKS